MHRVRQISGNNEATAVVEFAMLAVPFLVLVMGAIQLMIVLLTQQMIETATEAVTRKILTGYVRQNNLTQTQFVTLVCGLLPTPLDCRRLTLDVQVASQFSSAVVTRPDMSSYTTKSAPTVLTYNPGTAGQIVVLRLIYAVSVVSLPGFNMQATAAGFSFPMATSVFKNESYS